MLSFSAARSKDAASVPVRWDRTGGPRYSTGTLPLLRVWGVQIEKIIALRLAAQIFKYLEGF